MQKCGSSLGNPGFDFVLSFLFYLLASRLYLISEVERPAFFLTGQHD